ncbi:MAG: NAD(P)/FAD-dependent oxidoreductase [Candidatus Omnitrophica bacterium]|nr:NAD(P)/FAD-dependent oxidoreductase [Candidatus Omnitrophota bacterium]
MDTIDITIIGAGVIGLAVASCVAGKGRSVFIFEKNGSFGQEASSRNSEVIHAGIYYPAHSLKAKMCVEGKHLLCELCEAAHIPHKRIGKVIVARDVAEIPLIESLMRRGKNNGVDDLCIIDKRALNRLEPHVCGFCALHSPSTGIIDSHRLMQVLLSKATEREADILYGVEVLGAEKVHAGYVVRSRNMQGDESSFFSRMVINCAGINADTITQSVGINVQQAGYVVYPCKGEYFRVNAEKASLINRLVYPVPDAVSLGMHLTPDLAGGVRIGPNATYVDRNHIMYDVGEQQRKEFFTLAQRLVPSLEEEDIFPDTAGIRAKLQGPGDEIRDFVIAHEDKKGFPGFINLLGIESPGLTASLAIGKYVGTMVNEVLH